MWARVGAQKQQNAGGFSCFAETTGVFGFCGNPGFMEDAGVPLVLGSDLGSSLNARLFFLTSTYVHLPLVECLASLRPSTRASSLSAHHLF